MNEIAPKLADIPVFMDAEKAEQPPKPVRKAKKHRRATPREPFPFSYAAFKKAN